MPRVFAEHWNDYELLDAGNNQKLERFGKIITIRPERNAYFKPVLSIDEWKKSAHFLFEEKNSQSGNWHELKKDIPHQWQISYGKILLNLKLTKFKHVGVFPEQKVNWDFVQDHIKPNQKFLNLFGYTGAVSMIARKNSADVFHCDSIKQIIQWGKENMETSSLSDIHWILEDAVKFAQREVKRSNHYNGIIMDPPAFGIGVNKERWKIEDKFEELLILAKNLISENGFIIINTYSPRLSENDIRQLINLHFKSGKNTVDTLCIRSKTNKIVEFGQLTRLFT